jgi:3-phytase
VRSHIFLAVAALLGAGCTTADISGNSLNTELADKAQTIVGSINLSGSRGVAVGENTVLASASNGLLLVDGQGQRLSSIEGTFEQLDLRQREHHSLLATVDLEANQLVLAEIRDDKLTLMSRSSSPRFQIDNLCLYQSRVDAQTYAFVGDGDGNFQQLWLDLDNGQHRAVRALSVGPEVSHCVADDRAAEVFFTEPGAGVWAYGAEAEAPVERELRAATEPFGNLPKALEGLAIAGDAVFVVAEDESAVYKLKGDTVETLTVAGIDEAKSISVTAEGKAVVFDDGEDDYKVLDLPVSTNKHIAEPVLPIVHAVMETPPVDRFGDAADDPAIWYNKAKPMMSRVLGTHKRYGLMVYDLQGNELQSFASGRVNNVDVRYGLEIGGKIMDIAAASNRTKNSISLYSINTASGDVAWLSDVATDLNDVYGLCMYQSQTGIYAFINDKDGRYQQYRINGGQKPGAEKVREFSLPSQPEGCVADDDSARLFMGEEAAGVWLIDAEPASKAKPKLIMRTGAMLHADVEGIAIAKGNAQHKRDYLLISSQGNNSYVVAEAEAPYRIRGAVRVGINGADGIDGSSETDGLEIISHDFGGAFDGGLMVVQDGFNLMPQEPQNFKYISWRDVVETLKLD